MKQVLSFLTIFLLSLYYAFSISGADLTPEQLAFRSSIMQFIREEGFSPYIDEEDNTISFKKEGVLYWIGVSEGSPFYVEFHRNNVGTTDADKRAVFLSAEQTTKNIKCVKAISAESSVALVIEMFCHSPEEFKYIFYRSIKELDKADSMLKDEYAGFEGSANMPFSFVSSDVANVKEDGSSIAGYGANIYSYNTRYLKPRITLDVNSGGKYDIYVKMYNASGNLSTGDSSPSGYSYVNTVNMERGIHTYELSGWGADKDGKWGKGIYKFEFYYNGNLIGSKSFTIK